MLIGHLHAPLKDNCLNRLSIIFLHFSYLVVGVFIYSGYVSFSFSIPVFFSLYNWLFSLYNSTLLIMPFTEEKFLILMKPKLLIFSFVVFIIFS